MRIIDSIVNKEGIDSKRIQTYVKNQLSDYYKSTYSLIESFNSSCSSFNDKSNYYQILFPYDTIISNAIEITSYKGYRYPLKISIQGTGDRTNFVHLVYETADNICKSYSTQPKIDCLETTTTRIKIPKDVYKGFRVALADKDIQGTYQICIWKIEIYGSFVREAPTCMHKHRNTLFPFAVLLLLYAKKE